MSACSSIRKADQDGPPLIEKPPAVDTSSTVVPRHEPRSKYGNPPSYVVFGKRYYTLPSSRGFVQRGIASWYGKKFHGRRTSSGETYDMYAMTAAHTQLPLPTYVQVTNLKNGKQVILRVNDRGPFHGNRIIDLSYTAAVKLDIVREGTGLVEVRALDPNDYQREYSSTQNLVQSKGVANNKTQDSTNKKLNSIEEESLEQTAVIQHAGHLKEESELTDATTISASGPKVFVQVGAFGQHENAKQLVNQLSTLNLGKLTISSIIHNAQQLHRVRIGPLETVESADATVAQLNAMGMTDYRVVIE